MNYLTNMRQDMTSYSIALKASQTIVSGKHIAIQNPKNGLWGGLMTTHDTQLTYLYLVFEWY